MMAAPGEYTATLIKVIEGISTELSIPQTFEVKRMRKGALAGSTPEETATFWRELEDINLELSAVSMMIRESLEKLSMMEIALGRSQSRPGELDKKIHDLSRKLHLMNKQLNGDPLKK